MDDRAECGNQVDTKRRPIRLSWLIGVAFCAAVSGNLVSQKVRADAMLGCDISQASVQAPAGLTYGPRDNNRCEGLYAEPVSLGETLVIRSVHWDSVVFSPKQLKPLHISWVNPAPTHKVVDLKAFSLRPRLHYRMDARISPQSDSFTWDTRLLFHKQILLTPDELGLIACAEGCTESGTIPRFLPVRVAQGHAPASDAQRLNLVVVPRIGLQELYVTLVGPLNSDGEGRVVVDEQPQQWGYYPAGRPVLITLDVSEHPGRYRVELAAELNTGSAATTDLLVDVAEPHN